MDPCTTWLQVHSVSWQETNHISLAYINTLAPGRYCCNFKSVIFKHKSWIHQELISWNWSQVHAAENLWWWGQHWFRLWLGALRQQAITWSNVDLDIHCHMLSLGHNELTHWGRKMQAFCRRLIYIGGLMPFSTEKGKKKEKKRKKNWERPYTNTTTLHQYEINFKKTLNHCTQHVKPKFVTKPLL